jgi:uncharacterized membrane protein YidH (DUF202 family)
MKEIEMDTVEQFCWRTHLAECRTEWSAERTLLAYIRTAIGVLATGIGFLLLFERTVLLIIGFVFIASAVGAFIFGWIRFFYLRALIRREITAQAGENNPG